MAAEGVILTEIHGLLIGIDQAGNLVLGTKGNMAQTPLQVSPRLVGKGIPYGWGISAAKGASSNLCNVSFQLQDVNGNAVAQVVDFDLYLSDAATGIGLTGTTASGGVAALAASGTVLGALTTSKAIRAQTNAAGLFTLVITDTAKTAFYPCAQFGEHPVQVGAQLATANYA